MASEELRFWVVRPANLPEEAEDWVGVGGLVLGFERGGGMGDGRGEGGRGDSGEVLQ